MRERASISASRAGRRRRKEKRWIPGPSITGIRHVSPPLLSLSLSLSLAPLSHIIFLWTFPAMIFIAACEGYECTRRTHNRPGRALILSEILFKEVAILNRISQGRLRNPARHCEDANQFSSRGSFSRYFHRRASTKHQGRGGSDMHRVQCMCSYTSIVAHTNRPRLLSTPFSPWFLRFVPSFDACVYRKRGTRGTLSRTSWGEEKPFNSWRDGSRAEEYLLPFGDCDDLELIYHRPGRKIRKWW